MDFILVNIDGTFYKAKKDGTLIKEDGERVEASDEEIKKWENRDEDDSPDVEDLDFNEIKDHPKVQELTENLEDLKSDFEDLKEQNKKNGRPSAQDRPSMARWAIQLL